MDISAIDQCLWSEIKKHLDNLDLYVLNCVCVQFNTKQDKISFDKNYRVTSVASKLGYLDILKWLVSTGSKPSKRISYLAAANNHLPVLEWYITINKLDDYLIKYSGNVEVYNWLIEHGCRYSDDVLESVIKNGNLELLKRLPHQKEYSNSLCDIAVANGNWEVLDWLLQRGSRFRHFYVSVNIAKNQVQTLQVLTDHRQEIPENIASKVTGIDAIKWCANHGFRIDIASVNACRKGDIEILQYLIENGLELTSCLTIEAARGGQFECLKWLVSKGCPLSYFETAFAALSGRIDIIEWLLKQGCELDDGTVISVCEKGMVNVIEWLSARNCELNYPDMFHKALEYSNSEILEWLDNKGYRHQDNSIYLAIANDSVKTLEWLLNHGYKSDITLRMLISSNCENILRWYVEQGNVIPDEEIRNILTYCTLDIIKFLYKRGYKIPDSLCSAAALLGDLKCVKWTIKHGHILKTEDALYAMKYPKIINWMLDNGYVPDNEFIRNCSVEVFELLLCKGYKISDLVK